MVLVTSSNAPSANPWLRSSSASECGSGQLSGACALLALLVHAQTNSQDAARTDIELNAQKLDQLKQQLADAIQKAKDAAHDSGFFGFLGDVFGTDIAQIAGAVAAVAAVVATGGAAAPLIAIALSEALQVAAKYAPELGLPPEACLAIAVASVAVGFCAGNGGQAAGTVANIGRDVEVVAKVTAGAATIQGAVFHYTAAQYEADNLRYQADTVGYDARSDTTNLDIDDALDLLSRALRIEQHETSTASEIARNNSDANTAISARI